MNYKHMTTADCGQMHSHLLAPLPLQSSALTGPLHLSALSTHQHSHTLWLPGLCRNLHSHAHCPHMVPMLSFIHMHTDLLAFLAPACTCPLPFWNLQTHAITSQSSTQPLSESCTPMPTASLTSTCTSRYMHTASVSPVQDPALSCTMPTSGFCSHLHSHAHCPILISTCP